MRKFERVVCGDMEDKEPGMLEIQRNIIIKLESITIFIEEQKNNRKWFSREILSALIGAGVAAVAVFFGIKR